MVQNQYDVIVIGAGHNGLVTAGYLAKDGLSVLVLERLDQVGGACTTDEIFPGFKGPMCAYGCSMLQGKVVDDLRLREHGFEIIKPGPRGSGLHPFPDGTYLGGPEIGGSLDQAHQIRELSLGDAQGFLQWEAFWEEASSVLYPFFMTEPPTLSDLAESVRGTAREGALEKMLTWSLVDLVDSLFEDERVKAFALGVGEADIRAPGSVMTTAYFRCGRFSRERDSGLPRGGMGMITKAMADSAVAFGAELRTGTPVERIVVEDGVARGVRLAGGEEIGSSIVVSNADPKRTYLTLVDPEDLDGGFVRDVRSIKTRVSCVKFLAALSEAPDVSRYLGAGYDRDSVSIIAICPSPDYRQRSWDDAVSGRPTGYPVMQLQVPSLVDRSLTSKGGHVMSNWVLYQPPRLAEGTWDEAKESVGEQIIDAISDYAPGFRDSIIDWTVQTPFDLEQRVGLTDGSIRHGEMLPQQMLSRRQSHRAPIENLYLCGAGTHPGGEVTGAPGHNAAQAILKDIQRVVR